MSEKKFSVYRFSGDSLKKEGEFLGYGRGPYEMMIARVAFDPDTRSLTMLADYNRENRFCWVSLDPPENLYDVSTWEYRQLSFIGDCSLGEPCLIDRSSYLTMGHHTDSLNMFSLLDIDGGRVVPLDFSYPALPLGLSPMVQEVVWTGRIRKHPRKNRFVYNAQDFKYLFIFELEEGNHIRIIRYLYDKLPQVHATREQGHPYAFDDACEDGCNSIAVDDDHIYIGYSQTTYGQIRDAARARKSLSTFDPRRINVYDWDGNFIRRLVLDMPVGPMVVVGDRLVAASVNPETAEEIIVSYPLH
nr:BF3164 family lipoprotein [Alistipes onderdonkii]